MTWHREILTTSAAFDPSQVAVLGFVWLQIWEALT